MKVPTTPALWLPWLLAVVVAVAGFALRWAYFDGDHSHPDEPITVGVLHRMRQSGDWDTNWAKADLPAEYRYDQYNFSSYFRGLYLYYRVVKALPGTEAFRGRQEGFALYRSFSVFCAWGVVLAVLWIGWSAGGPSVALLGGALTATAPLLVQDAHYARPESFCTLLFAVVVALCLRPGGFALGRACLAALLMGVLLACKVSFAIVAWLPWLALLPPDAPPVPGKRDAGAAGASAKAGPSPAGRWIRRALGAGAPLAALLLGFAAGVPGAFTHPAAFLNGVRALSNQYAGLHPPHSHVNGGPVADLLWTYLGTTLGWACLAAALLGVFDLARRRRWLLLGLLACPLLLTLGAFSTRTVFFERNCSHVLPLLALAAALGAMSGLDWFAARGLTAGQRAVVAAALAFLVLARPLSVTARLVGVAFAGQDRDQLVALERQLLGRHSGAKILEASFFFDEEADQFAKTVEAAGSSAGRPLLLRHCSWGDEWTRPFETRLMARLSAEKVAARPSLFGEIPCCTLHTYLSPNFDYYLVRPKSSQPGTAR